MKLVRFFLGRWLHTILFLTFLGSWLSLKSMQCTKSFLNDLCAAPDGDNAGLNDSRTSGVVTPSLLRELMDGSASLSTPRERSLSTYQSTPPALERASVEALSDDYHGDSQPITFLMYIDPAELLLARIQAQHQHRDAVSWQIYEGMQKINTCTLRGHVAEESAPVKRVRGIQRGSFSPTLIDGFKVECRDLSAQMSTLCVEMNHIIKTMDKAITQFMSFKEDFFSRKARAGLDSMDMVDAFIDNLKCYMKKGSKVNQLFLRFNQKVNYYIYNGCFDKDDVEVKAFCLTLIRLENFFKMVEVTGLAHFYRTIDSVFSSSPKQVNYVIFSLIIPKIISSRDIYNEICRAEQEV